MFLFSNIISETQIKCWLPGQFSDEQADYTHQLCWINNTYYYPDVTDADLFPESNKDTILYYQYILFILFGQALLFFLPTMAWELLARNSTGYIRKILDDAQKSKSPSKDDLEKWYKKFKELKIKKQASESKSKSKSPAVSDTEYSKVDFKTFREKSPSRPNKHERVYLDSKIVNDNDENISGFPRLPQQQESQARMQQQPYQLSGHEKEREMNDKNQPGQEDGDDQSFYGFVLEPDTSKVLAKRIKTIAFHENCTDFDDCPDCKEQEQQPDRKW